MLNLTNSQSRIINLKNLFNELNKLLHKTIILTYIVEINLIGRFLLILRQISKRYCIFKSEYLGHYWLKLHMSYIKI